MYADSKQSKSRQHSKTSAQLRGLLRHISVRKTFGKKHDISLPIAPPVPLSNMDVMSFNSLDPENGLRIYPETVTKPHIDTKIDNDQESFADLNFIFNNSDSSESPTSTVTPSARSSSLHNAKVSGSVKTYGSPGSATTELRSHGNRTTPTRNSKDAAVADVSESSAYSAAIKELQQRLDKAMATTAELSRELHNTRAKLGLAKTSAYMCRMEAEQNYLEYRTALRRMNETHELQFNILTAKIESLEYRNKLSNWTGVDFSPSRTEKRKIQGLRPFLPVHTDI